MRKRESFAPCLAIAVAVAMPLGVVEGAEILRGPIRVGVPGIPVQPTTAPAPIGPMPRLDPIHQFITPIDPWKPGGFGWDVEGIDDQGDPFCLTNHRPTPTCDPDGPRAFLHAGFDAAPAPDRVVRASAQGRVVVARPSSALVTGRSQGEGAGVVVLEHDRDGDPATGDDHLLTVYGHVDPEVVVGQIVAQGDRIALTATVGGNEHLHFGVRQGPFVPADLDVFRAFLPPPGTIGCADCYSRPLPAPTFPDLWQDPAQLFVASPSWLSIYGEPDDAASDVIETDDGYMAFGYTWNQPGASSRSMAVRRLDREGDVVSQRAYYSSGLDAIKHVERTPDGGIIALAVSLSTTGAQVPMLVKFDAAGEPQWARQYGVEATAGTPPVRLWWEDIAVTADGGYIVTGTAQSNPPSFLPATVAVARLDATGNVQWLRTYTPRFVQLGIDGKGIAPTADGGFVVLAEYRSPFSPPQITAKDLVVFRIDADGGVLWGTIVGNGLNDGRAGQIEAAPDGGVVVAGYFSVQGPFLPIRMWVLKLNGDGTIAWSSLYSSASSNTALAESGTRLALTSDGGYVIAGRRTSYLSDPFGPDTDLVLLRLDGRGEVVGQRRLDSLGVSTTPLGLRAASDGGFLLAGGAESDCRGCPFLTEGAARFVVAHLDNELDCSGQCTGPYDFVRLPPPPAIGPVDFVVGVLTATQVDTQLTGVDTTGRRHPCNNGIFGAPPVFDPASINAVPQTAVCDRTEYVEAYLCSLGIPGAQAVAPVILYVNYDSLLLTGHVVDGDSTPEQNDVFSVAANLFASQAPDPHSEIPMLDDGSLTSLPGIFNDVSDCTEDPVAGVCGCTFQHAPAFSGDVTTGDGIYTLESSLILPTFPPVFQDVRLACVIQNRPRNTLHFNPGTAVNVILRATDRIGNVASTSATVTPSGTTASCTGDACGCCLLASPDPVTQCAGLPGMPTLDFPDGLCLAF
jgi:murein DD-endopeptidase MepM/ murein hydrolase activator NlpD